MSAQLNLVPTAGAALIGVFISSAMYGFTTFQVYHYFQLSWNVDKWGLKAYIFYIWVAETVHAALCCAFVFRFAILNFGNPVSFATTQVSDDVTTGMTGVIIFSIHLFYARRLWILSDKNILLVSVVGILAVAHFALEMTVMALTFKWPEFSEFRRITGYYTASLAVAAADDIIIAVSLAYLLYTRRSGISRTNTLINRIVTYSVTTGAITSVVNIAILICFVAMPQNLVYLGLYNFVPNLYANSLLAMLNARESLQKLSVDGLTRTGDSTNIALGNLRGRQPDARMVRNHDDDTHSKITFAVPYHTTTTMTTDSV